MSKRKRELPSHTPGTKKGGKTGTEPGRKHGVRTSRDSTSINPSHHGPIDPRMPHMPPP